MTLDVKLAIALLAFFKDDKAHVTETSQRMLSLIDEQMGATGNVARGRQVLNVLWHNLTSGIYTTTVVTWQTLAGVQLIGNKSITGGIKYSRRSGPDLTIYDSLRCLSRS